MSLNPRPMQCVSGASINAFTAQGLVSLTPMPPIPASVVIRTTALVLGAAAGVGLDIGGLYKGPPVCPVRLRNTVRTVFRLRDRFTEPRQSVTIDQFEQDSWTHTVSMRRIIISLRVGARIMTDLSA